MKFQPGIFHQHTLKILSVRTGRFEQKPTASGSLIRIASFAILSASFEYMYCILKPICFILRNSQYLFLGIPIFKVFVGMEKITMFGQLKSLFNP